MGLKFELGCVYYDNKWDTYYVCTEQFGKNTISYVYWIHEINRLVVHKSDVNIGDERESYVEEVPHKEIFCSLKRSQK